MPNLRFNGTFGQIPAILKFRRLLWAPCAAYNFIDHRLRKISGQSRAYSSVMSNIYGRLADFVLTKLTADENDCSGFELFILILTNLFNAIDYANPLLPANECGEPSGLDWIVRFDWKV